MLTSEEVEIRAKCRIETLEELASLTDNGLVLDSPALREMASECRRAMMAVAMLDAIYPIEPEHA